MSNNKSTLEVNKHLQEVTIHNEEKEEVKIDMESLQVDQITIEANNETFSNNPEPFKSKCDEDKIARNIDTSKQSEKESRVVEYSSNELNPKNPPTFWVQFHSAGMRPNNPHGGNFDYDPATRNYFVKFVFTVLLIMLLITGIFTIYVMTSPDLKHTFMIHSMMIMIISMVVLLVMNYVMVCSACGRVPPCNFISLIIVVAAMSCVVSVVTIRMKTDIILYALLATTVTVAICIGLACTNFDFTQWYIYLIVICTVFCVIAGAISFSMLVMGTRYKPLIILILFGSALLNVMLLIMELQMILGGRSLEMSEDDYALGAFLLYTTIVNLFLDILQLLAQLDE